MKVSALIALFIQQCVRNGNKQNSIDHYKGRLKRFDEVFGDRNVKSLEREEILDHIHKSGQGLSDSTKRANIVAVERLQKYAKQFKHLKGRWFRQGDVLKPPQGRREQIPTPDQTQAIIAKMRPRARLIYRALRLTGARPGEMCNANIEDLKGEPGERMIVLTDHKTARKTGRPRIIILSPAAEELVVGVIGERTAGPIFLTSRGNRWIRDRLSRAYRKARNEVGAPRSLVLYSTRHEAATEIVRKVGIEHARIQLGHATIQTTMRYTHLPLDDVRAAVAKAIQDVKPDNEDRGAKDANGLEVEAIGRSDQGDETGIRRAA